jgi:hypothetical protein
MNMDKSLHFAFLIIIFPNIIILHYIHNSNMKYIVNKGDSEFWIYRQWKWARALVGLDKLYCIKVDLEANTEKSEKSLKLQISSFPSL